MIMLFLCFREKETQAQTGEGGFPNLKEVVLFYMQRTMVFVVVLLDFFSFHASVAVKGIFEVL